MQQKFSQASAPPNKPATATASNRTHDSLFRSSRRIFLRNVATALLGSGTRIPTSGKFVDKVLGLDVARIRNVTAFGRACSRMTTNARELRDFGAAVSGSPNALFTLLSGSNAPITSAGEAMMHAHRFAGAAVFPSHFSDALSLRASGDAHIVLDDMQPPDSVLKTFRSELMRGSSNANNYARIANDAELARKQLREAWGELRNMLGNMDRRESWVQTGISDLPEHLSPALNLIRQSITHNGTSASLASDVAFETNLRIIDLVHGAEQFIADGQITLARVCAERARDIHTRLGNTFPSELSRELDKRLKIIEATDMPIEEGDVGSQQSHPQKFQAPALPSIEQILSYRAKESDVLLLCMKGRAPILYYTTNNIVPWEEKLDVARIHDNLKFALQVKDASTPVLFYAQKGFSHLSSITLQPAQKELPISDYDRAMICTALSSINMRFDQLISFELE